jgi:hypothetical protein
LPTLAIQSRFFKTQNIKEDPLTDREEILEALRLEIKQTEIENLEPLPGDKWLISSCWQKAVRRGDLVTAVMAASALWKQDRQSLWRRLHITALEDIGAGDAYTVTKVLTATASTTWRRQLGDERVALHLTRLMCGSVKNRMGDELFIQVERDPGYDDLRKRLAKADDNLLADYAAHENSPLIERSLALWYLTGTKKFPSETMPGRVGTPEKAVHVLRGLNAPADLVESCISVMGRTSWPLSIFMPLIWQEVRKQARPQYIFYDPIPPSPAVEGVPVYAADMFTRVGQASIRELQKSASDLKGFSVRQIGLALFYIEGCRVENVLTSEWLEQFRHDGEFVDAESVGLDAPLHLGLRECLSANLSKLNDIRQRKIRQALEGAV